MRILRDADRLQADPGDARPAAGGHQQAITAQLAPVAELEHEVVAVAAGGGGPRAELQLDAVAPQRLAQPLAQRGGLARQHAIGALDHHDLGAEAARHLGQLDPGRAGPQHEQAARDDGHAGRLAVGPDAVELAQTGDGRDERVGAEGDDDVLGGVAAAVDLDGPGARQAPGAADELDAAVGQPLHR